MNEIAYRAAEGVDFVDGRAVPADRIVRLTPSQALYDLAQGWIEAVGEERTEPPVSAEDDVPSDDPSPNEATAQTPRRRPS